MFIAILICGIYDFKKYIIPNVITLPLIGIGLIYQIYNQGWADIIFAFIVCLVLLMLGILTNGIGGGDIKLITAIFLWLTPQAALKVLIVSSFIGVIWGLSKKIKVLGFQAVGQKQMSKLISLSTLGVKAIYNNDDTDKLNIVPYGTCIAIGLVIYSLYLKSIGLNLV